MNVFTGRMKKYEFTDNDFQRSHFVQNQKQRVFVDTSLFVIQNTLTASVTFTQKKSEDSIKFCYAPDFAINYPNLKKRGTYAWIIWNQKVT